MLCAMTGARPLQDDVAAPPAAEPGPAESTARVHAVRPGEGTADAAAHAALLLHERGVTTWSDHRSVTAALRDALALRDQPDVLHVRLSAALARSLLHDETADRTAAEQLAGRAVSGARELGDPRALAESLHALLTVTWAPGQAARRLALAREMEQAAHSGRLDRHVVLAGLEAFGALLELGDPSVHVQLDRSVRWQANRVHPESGDGAHLAWLLLTRRTALALVTGDVETAAGLVAQEEAEGRRLEEPDVLGVVMTHRMSLLRWQVDLLTVLGRAGIDETADHPAARATSEVVRLVARGDRAAAADVLRTRLEPLCAAAPGWVGLTPTASCAEFALAIGALESCERLYAALSPYEGTFALAAGGVDCDGPVSLLLGRLAAALGRRDDAVRHLRRAVDECEVLAAVLWGASSALELAAALGPGDESARLLERATTSAGRSDVLRARLDEVRRSVLQADADGRPAELRRDRTGWVAVFAGRTARLPAWKGLHDIALLLSRPGEGVAAAHLVAPEAVGEALMGADPVLDEQARAEYRHRLAELAARAERAAADGDDELAAAVSQERDLLVGALAQTYGLGGRQRLLGDGAERARKAVTNRIADSIRRVEALHPELAAHLRRSVRTGRTCTYLADPPVTWVVALRPARGQTTD